MNSLRGFYMSLVLLSVCFAVAFGLAAQWERALVNYIPYGDIARGQSSGEEGEEEESEEEEPAEEENQVEDRAEKGTAQRIRRVKGILEAKYNFVNFNRDRLHISFSMPAREYRAYLSGYGYSEAKLASLNQWRNDTRRLEWDKAVRTGGQAAGEEALKAVEWEYKVRLNDYFRSRGFELQPGNTISCDIPAVVKRNVRFLKSLALAFQDLSSARGYGPEETVGAVLAMAQTALRYKLPPMVEGDIHTGGILPPGRALLSGWGDCDTKTALVASILGNWSGMRLVGIAVPGHYLMAIRRIPAKGDLFVTYNGVEYVLIEPAGPAWLEPGTVGTATTALLEGAEGYKIEPFFGGKKS